MAVLVAAGVVAWIELAKTSIPTDLKTPTIDAHAEFAGLDLSEAESFERFLRWTFIASLVTRVVVLVIYARRGAGFIKQSAAGPIGTGFLLGILGFGIAWLAQLPFRILDFWWANKHDAIPTSWFEFLFGDWLELAVQAVFISFALLVAMGLARKLRTTWWLPATGVFIGLTVLLAFVSPYLLPMRDPRGPELRAEAAEIARKEGVPDIPLKIQEVRDITDAPNAYAIGLGSTRRVVLWDTIVDFPRDEVKMVLAHEYGHQAHDHIAKSLGWSALLLLPTAGAVAFFTRRRGGMGLPEAVPLALLVYVVMGLLTTPIQSAASRRYEREADWAALQTMKDPVAMKGLFRDFTETALADPDPPGWFHKVFDSHPSGIERVRMAGAWALRNGQPLP